MGASPSESLATLRPDLGGSLEEFDLAADRQGFVGLKLLPVFETEVQSGNVGKIKLEQLLENRETSRAPGAGYARSSWQFEKWTFATEEHGAEETLDDRQSKMYKNYFDFEMVNAERARDVVLRNQEKRIAALLHDTALYTGATKFLSITDEWDDADDAIPIDDIDAGKTAIWGLTGLWPNVLQINRFQLMALRKCDQIIERLKYQGFHDVIPSKVTPSMLAQVFDLDEVVVAGSAKNTAAKGQTRSLASIWSSEYAFLGRRAMTNDPREPCLGRTFHWADDGSNIGTTVETYREEGVRGGVVRCRHDVNEVLMYDACGFLFGNVLTI